MIEAVLEVRKGRPLHLALDAVFFWYQDGLANTTEVYHPIFVRLDRVKTSLSARGAGRDRDRG